MRQMNTCTLREPGSTVLIKKNDHYTGTRTTRLNKLNTKYVVIHITKL
jgi:hypothetical protein